MNWGPCKNPRRYSTHITPVVNERTYWPGTIVILPPWSHLALILLSSCSHLAPTLIPFWSHLAPFLYPSWFHLARILGPSWISVRPGKWVCGSVQHASAPRWTLPIHNCSDACSLEYHPRETWWSRLVDRHVRTRCSADKRDRMVWP